MKPDKSLEDRSVVTAFLRHGDRILVLRRSAAVGTYQGKWSAVSGYLESTPLEQAITEIREETGVQDSALRLVSAGEPMVVPDAAIGVRWTIHPFLFDLTDPDRIRLDWENVDLRWIDPEELATLPSVPALADAYARCLTASNTPDTP